MTPTDGDGTADKSEARRDAETTTAAPAESDTPERIKTTLLPVAQRLLSEAGRSVSTLYHYTDQAGFIGILKSGSMWATMIQFLNDSREYQHGLELIAKEVAARIDKDAVLKAQVGMAMRGFNMQAWTYRQMARGPLRYSGTRAEPTSASRPPTQR